MKGVKVKIIAFADDSQPGWVRCVLTDVFGKDWYFTEKIPIVTDEDLRQTSDYPCDGVINCIVVSEKEETVVIDTNEPFSINSEDYESKFTVLKSQLIEE